MSWIFFKILFGLKGSGIDNWFSWQIIFFSFIKYSFLICESSVLFVISNKNCLSLSLVITFIILQLHILLENSCDFVEESLEFLISVIGSSLSTSSDISDSDINSLVNVSWSWNISFIFFFFLHSVDLFPGLLQFQHTIFVHLLICIFYYSLNNID